MGPRVAWATPADRTAQGVRVAVITPPPAVGARVGPAG
jgi:hypothetical protein